MEYSVIVTSRAENNIIKIGEYIASQLHAPEAARNLVDALERQIADLSYMPKIYAVVSDARLAQKGIRAVHVKNYSVFYTVDDELQTVVVIRVMYSGRDWVNLL